MDSTRCFCSHGYVNILGQTISHSYYIIGTCECRMLCLMTRITLLGYNPFCFYAYWKSILDWDGVAAVPLKLSTISIAQSFFPEDLQKLGLKLDTKLDVLFRQELSRILSGRSHPPHNGPRCFCAPRKTSFCSTFYDSVTLFRHCEETTPSLWMKLFTALLRRLPSLNLNGQHLQMIST